MGLRRSLLFVPGNNPAMVQQAGLLGADTVILDLEDAVSPREKDAARMLVRQALKTVRYGCEIIVRINTLDSFAREDLAAIVPCAPSAILLPKVNAAADILQTVALLDEYEKEGQKPLEIIALIETPLGVANCFAIATAHHRVTALALGAEDYTAGLGAQRTKAGTEIFTARTTLVNAAAAAEIAAIDTPFTDVHDDEGFTADLAVAKQLGFKGKLAISPRHVEEINNGFSPTAVELEWAERVLAAIEQAQAQGSGVIAIDGKMVDKPIADRAKRVIALAAAIGTGATGQDKTASPEAADKSTSSFAVQGADDAESVPVGMLKNAIGRYVPREIDGYGIVKPFAGAFGTLPDMKRYAPTVKMRTPGETKLLPDLAAALRKIPLRDGMTISFHHHFRNGDHVLNMVLREAAIMGIKDLKVASSSIFPIHAPLIEHIKNGVVSAIDTNYMSGPVAEAVSNGILSKPVIMRTHGGRARAIECGQLKIDIAFIAAPSADDYGNINGVQGRAACGALGYAMPDAEYADTVVAITDNLCPYPLTPVSIPQSRVDYVVVADSVGDPKGIVSGSTQITRDPIGLKIAKTAAQVIRAAGFIKEGLSFQTGAGGATLAAGHYIGQMMADGGFTANFAMGGITGFIVDMLEKGQLRTIIDVQGFDLKAVQSIGANPAHREVSASEYANPFNAGCIVNRLDTVLLGATEIDTDFNVNVTTGSNGVIMGGSGGHSDAAAGAKLTIVVANLLRGRLPIVVDRVLTATTPGETVDVLVTERGVAVNPRRTELRQLLEDAGLPVKDITELKTIAEEIAGVPKGLVTDDRIVAIVEYRDGSVIDVVRGRR